MQTRAFGTSRPALVDIEISLSAVMVSWPKTLIRQGLAHEVRITHLGEPPKKASVTGFAYFRTVVPAQMQKKGLSFAI
jgi:hypothetical protein